MPTQTTTPISLRLEQTVELYTKTPVIKRNYYSLYVDQACCFCAIVNRIIFFLFGRFGCFLGEAADQKGKISMQQEYALIENYNQAKQELLVALLAISKSSADPSAKDKWETAQINYKEAATKRATQVQQFGFSKKASDEGLSPTLLQLADARILELIRLLNKNSQIDTSTVTTDTLLFDRNRDASRLRNAYPELAIEAPPPRTKASKNETMPPPKKNEERDQLELQRIALQEQLKKTPNLDTLDSALWTSYCDAFKKYHTVSSKVDESNPAYFTLFYEEICHIIAALDMSVNKETQLQLAQALTTRFDLVKKDPQFLEHYIEALRKHYIDHVFKWPIEFNRIDISQSLLQVYFQAVKKVYLLVQPQKLESDAISNAKEQLALLLSSMQTRSDKFVSCIKPTLFITAIAQNLVHFQDGWKNAQARAFIEEILAMTTPPAQSSTSSTSSTSAEPLPLPVSPSPSSSSSSSSTASTIALSSSSSSSSSSSATSTSTSSSAESPSSSSSSSSVSIASSPLNLSNIMDNAGKDLGKALIQSKDVTLISDESIETYTEAVKSYKRSSNQESLSETDLSILDRQIKRAYSAIHPDKFIGADTQFLWQLFVLKMRVAQKWQLSTVSSLVDKGITEFLELSSFLTEFSTPPLRTALSKNSLTPFHIYYKNCKELHRFFNPTSQLTEDDAFATLQLKNLCAKLASRYATAYTSWINKSPTDPNSVDQALMQFAKGIWACRNNSPETDKLEADRFVKRIAGN